MKGKVFWENVLLFSVVCLSNSLSFVLSTSLSLFWALLCLVSLGLLGLIGLLGLLRLMDLMGLMGKKETHETLAHCCTIFLKSHLGIEIYMIDIEIQISISERSSDWAIN